MIAARKEVFKTKLHVNFCGNLLEFAKKDYLDKTVAMYANAELNITGTVLFVNASQPSQWHQKWQQTCRESTAAATVPPKKCCRLIYSKTGS